MTAEAVETQMTAEDKQQALYDEIKSLKIQLKDQQILLAYQTEEKKRIDEQFQATKQKLESTQAEL